MGSHAHLKVSGRNILTSSSYVAVDVALLFNEFDKEMIVENDDGEENRVTRYKTSASRAYERLQIVGFNAVDCLGKIKRCVLLEDADDGDDIYESPEENKMRKLVSTFPDADLAAKIAQNYSFMESTWKKAEGIEAGVWAIQRLIDDEYEWGETLTSLDVLAVIFAAQPKDAEVTLDITDLIAGGYCQQDEAVVEETARQANQKILVLTEGSSDAQIISMSMRLQKPYLYDLFAFMDYDLKPRGGATALSEMIKAFAASGSASRILGIFDNDTAGKEAALMLAGISLPKSIKYMHLPDIDTARSYPTIGPQGDNIQMDVNGCAVSIELFSSQDLLSSNGNFFPIVWGGYNARIQKYQGEVINKSAIAEAQITRLTAALNSSKQQGEHQWGEMPNLINAIIETCRGLRPRES